jgi:hypothetical protein
MMTRQEITYRCPQCFRTVIAEDMNKVYMQTGDGRGGPGQCPRATGNEPCRWTEVSRRDVQIR